MLTSLNIFQLTHFYSKIVPGLCITSTNISLFNCYFSSKKHFSLSCRNYLEETDDEFEYGLKNIDVNSIVDSYLWRMKIVQTIAREIDFLRQISVNAAPEKLSVDQWKFLLRIKDKNDRIKFYQSCLEPKKTAVDFSFGNTSEISVEFSKSIFLPNYDIKINRILDYKLSLAKLFGPHLFIDCRNEAQVKPYNITQSIDKLFKVWFVNRMCQNPFYITFCNVDRFGDLIRRLSEKIASIENLKYILDVSIEDITDLFPSEKLIYLSPASKNEMGEFNGDNIFVLGAFVDEIGENYSSLIVSKKYGFRTFKFPIDKFVNRKEKNQHLSSEMCIKILNDRKNGASWQYAFRHIPRHKLKCSFDIDSIQNNSKSKTFKKFKFKRIERVGT